MKYKNLEIPIYSIHDLKFGNKNHYRHSIILY